MLILTHRCNDATRLGLSRSYALSKIGKYRWLRGMVPRLLTDDIREVRFERATASSASCRMSDAVTRAAPATHPDAEVLEDALQTIARHIQGIGRSARHTSR